MDQEEKVFFASQNVLQNENGEILLLKREPSDYFAPNTFCFPGGKRDDGETFKECAIRETFEECGIETFPEKSLNYYEFYRRDTLFKIEVFYSKIVGQPEVKLSWEHTDFIWRTPEEALKLNLSSLITKEIIESLRNKIICLAIPIMLKEPKEIQNKTRKVEVISSENGIIKFLELEDGPYNKNIKRKLWFKGDIRFVEKSLWKFKDLKSNNLFF